MTKTQAIEAMNTKTMVWHFGVAGQIQSVETDRESVGGKTSVFFTGRTGTNVPFSGWLPLNTIAFERFSVADIEHSDERD